jgi:hypothetical protein
VLGAWHRLWSALASGYVFQNETSNETIAMIREEFEKLFGRKLSAEEMTRLAEHARAHAERVLKPIVRKHGWSGPGW